MAAVSSGTSHVRTKKRYKQLNHLCGLYSKRVVKRYSHSFRVTCDKSAVRLIERGEQRYIKVINNNTNMRDNELVLNRAEFSL